MTKALEDELNQEEVVEETVEEEAVEEQPEEELGEVEDVNPEDVQEEEPDQYAYIKQRREKQQLKEQKEEAERRYKELLERVTGGEQKPKEETIPDPDLDPDAYYRYEIQKLKEKTKKLDDIEEQQRRQEQIEAAKNELSGYEQAFKKSTPDYDEVLQNAMEVERRKIKAVYPNMTDTQINNHLEQSKIQLASTAMNNGRDPVEALYEYASAYGTPTKKPKTNLQAKKELSKPNAIGTGQGAIARTKTFNDLEEKDLDNLTFAEMKKLRKEGRL